MNVGPYRIERELGRGGMGAVYLARDPALDRYVAIKFLSDSYAGDEQVRERFLFEARSMAKVSDAHVAQVLMVGEVENRPYFAMEFLEGGSLSDLLRQQGRLSEQAAAYFIGQAAQGLHAAHEAGLVHRDIKPANLLLSARGLLKVADFGIALAPSAQRARLTTTGGVIGTPGYLSPEVCLGEQVTPAADQFALGVVFFELLTGQVPFQDISPMRSMYAVVERPTPALSEHSVQLSPGLEAILLRMLAKKPADRYPSCAHLADAIARAGIDLRARAHSPVPIEVNDVSASATTTKQQLSLPLSTLALAKPALSSTSTDQVRTEPQPKRGEKKSVFRRPIWAIASAIIALSAAVWFLRGKPEMPAVVMSPDKAPPTSTAPNMAPLQPESPIAETEIAPPAAVEAQEPMRAPNSAPGVREPEAPTSHSSTPKPKLPTAITPNKAPVSAANPEAPATPAPLPKPEANEALATIAKEEPPAVPATDPARLPIMVLAEGSHPALEAVRARIETKLRAGGANFLAPELMQEMQSLAQAGDTADAMIAARGKAIAMLEISLDEDTPTQLRVRIYEVSSRVSRGSWTLKLNSAGDDVEAIDDFALAEMAAQIRGYGG